MPKENLPIDEVAQFVPDNCGIDLINYIKDNKIHLTITRKRGTILGDYRPPINYKNHRISINGNLNKYAFFITFLHELAHLKTFEKYNRFVKPHGTEWKNEYALILNKYLANKIFPIDIELVIQNSISNLGASSCSEPDLVKVLRKYDSPTKTTLHSIEDLKIEEMFITEKGDIYQILEKQRTRYKCIKIATKQLYLFSGLYQVKRYQNTTI